jgi:chemotaxis protein CheD
MTQEITVGVGTFYVARNPTRLSCIGLGSCLAIALHDPSHRVGGLAHAMLPLYSEGRDKLNPGKYVDTSIFLMVDELMEMGVKKRTIKAKIVGGAQMFSFISPETLDVGTRNIETAKEILKKEGIPIASKDIGGTRGRTISFDIKTGRIEIKISGKKEEVI